MPKWIFQNISGDQQGVRILRLTDLQQHYTVVPKSNVYEVLFKDFKHLSKMFSCPELPLIHKLSNNHNKYQTNVPTFLYV